MPQQPPDDTQPKDNGKAKLAALLGTAGAGLLVAVVSQFEGKRNDPYQDIVGVWSVCYGETEGQMKHYTDDECRDKLARALVRYAEPVGECADLQGHPNQLVAASSLAYNIGAANFCHSTAAQKFRRHDYKGGCKAMLSWDRAGGRVVKGLTNRRLQEYKICMTGLDHAK